MSYTESQIEKMIETHEELISRISRVCYIIHEIDKDAPHGYDPSEDKLEIGFNSIEVNWETVVGCMGHYDTEYHGYSIPTEYLWMSDEEIRGITTKKIREREEKEAQRKAKLAADKAARKEKADYEQYVKLKEKYE